MFRTSATSFGLEVKKKTRVCGREVMPFHALPAIPAIESLHCEKVTLQQVCGFLFLPLKGSAEAAGCIGGCRYECRFHR